MDCFTLDARGNPYMDTHIPFCSCKGEDILVGSGLFQRNHLSLYACVPFSLLSEMFDPKSRFLRRRGDPERLDYLICQGERPLAAVVLECGSSSARVDGPLLPPGTHVLQEQADENRFLPVMLVSETAMLKGSAAPLLDSLDKLISAGSGPRYRCPIHALTREEFPRFAAPSKGLLQVSGNVTRITEYGRSLGLFRGHFSRSTHRICVFPRDLAVIRKSEFHSEVSLPPVVSFAQRKERIAAGLPCDKTAVTQSIREFGLMPLSVYFRDYPENLRIFQSVLKKDATFQDAARYVAALMREEQPGVCAFTGALTPGKSLMMRLAEPVLSQDM